jgi:hypothetical protein
VTRALGVVDGEVVPVGAGVGTTGTVTEVAVGSGVALSARRGGVATNAAMPSPIASANTSANGNALRIDARDSVYRLRVGRGVGVGGLVGTTGVGCTVGDGLAFANPQIVQL